jgi:hypothetical protein
MTWLNKLVKSKSSVKQFETEYYRNIEKKKEPAPKFQFGKITGKKNEVLYR